MEYVKNNAVLFCSCSPIPCLLKVTSNSKVKAQEGIFATHKDNIGGQNISGFKICSSYVICNISGLQLNWINTVPKITILGNKPLLDTSKLICPKGGVISVFLSGQM